MNSTASECKTPEALAQEMLVAAKEESVKGSAFFGALLTLRYGRDLKAHVHALMQKFDAMQLQGGGTAGQAFRYIAAMHAEGFEFLSAKVLAKTMGCDEAVFKREVLKPLSDEAATGTGQFLRIRHKKIAATVLQLCEDDDIDLQDLYLPLVEAAIHLRQLDSEWRNEVKKWEYDLIKHFIKTDRKELAIAIAEKMHDTVPDNSYYVVNLARLRRENNDVPGAINALKDITPPPQNDRAYWLEWGMVSGMQEKWFANAALHAYSISDNPQSQIKHRHAVLAFSGLAKAFAELYEESSQTDFFKARVACAWLGLKLESTNSRLNDHSKAVAAQAKPKDVNEGLAWFQSGLNAACANKILEREYIDLIGEPHQFQFKALKSLLANPRKGPNE